MELKICFLHLAETLLLQRRDILQGSALLAPLCRECQCNTSSWMSLLSLALWMELWMEFTERNRHRHKHRSKLPKLLQSMWSQAASQEDDKSLRSCLALIDLFFSSILLPVQFLVLAKNHADKTTIWYNPKSKQHKIHIQITLFGLLRKFRNSSATTTTNSAAATVYCLLFPKKKPKTTKNTMEIYFSTQNLCINWNQSRTLSITRSLDHQ